MARPIGVDLFAGAGGLSLGFELAGFDVVAAVEVDPVHAATHKYNFPDTATICRSVVGLSSKEIRKNAGIDDRDVDVVFGGAPCQGFSLIGQRAMDDPRNQLVREFLRIVNELEASYFVFENVKGLTVGRHRRFLDELVEEAGQLGYEVQLPWRVLNASDYSVPQNRERLFLLGARKGLQIPKYPEATTSREDRVSDCTSPTPTCEEALGDLPEVEHYPELASSDEVLVERWGTTSNYAKKLRCEGRGAWGYAYRRKWDPSLLTSSMRTAHTVISQRRFKETQPGSVEPISRFFKLAPSGVSNTLRAGTDSSRGAFTSPRPIHYSEPRCVTVREMARLHGYPDWFRFHVTKWHGARQVGNSVPPPLARAIAGCVLNALGHKPNRPRRQIQLGDTALLSLDMGQAAQYFGVKVPIGNRDRKSGSKKRRQEDIERERLVAKGGE